MTGIRWLPALAVLAGCAGQLDLAPEAYQANAQNATSADSGDGAGPGWDAGAPGPGIGSGPPGPWPPADAGTAAGDAGWVADGPAATAVDAAGATSLPPAASVCPAGVDALALIAQRCGGCHGERMPSKGLDLVTPGLADRLVGVT